MAAGTSALNPNLPSPSSQLHTAEARAALVASMSNLLDGKLQTRASQLHSNSTALSRQERDVAKATDALRRETDKLEKVAKDAGRRVKELGNVQNWAEVLERDLLVIEETIRLANKGVGGGSGRRRRGEGDDNTDGNDSDDYDYDDEGSERCSECMGSCCWSGSEAGGDDSEAERAHKDGAIPNGHTGATKLGVNVDINEDLLASISEAMTLDIRDKPKVLGRDIAAESNAALEPAITNPENPIQPSDHPPSVETTLLG